MLPIFVLGKTRSYNTQRQIEIVHVAAFVSSGRVSSIHRVCCRYKLIQSLSLASHGPRKQSFIWITIFFSLTQDADLQLILPVFPFLPRALYKAHDKSTLYPHIIAIF